MLDFLFGPSQSHLTITNINWQGALQSARKAKKKGCRVGTDCGELGEVDDGRDGTKNDDISQIYCNLVKYNTR